MTSVELVPAGVNRVALAGLVLPSPPPTRIYIGTSAYDISAPRVPLPPIINVARVIFNWSTAFGRVARNVMYVLKGSGGTGSTSDPAYLLTLAEDIKTAYTTAAFASSLSSVWSLNSVTCHDAGGTSATATTTSPALPGGVSGTCTPPQCAIVLSWRIAASYRGGKPRTYLPGIPDSALGASGQSQLNPPFATALQTSGANFLIAVNGIVVESSPTTLGTVSYRVGHAIRPTPIFQPFQGVRVHERIDSQRRRSGKESSFPTVP